MKRSDSMGLYIHVPFCLSKCHYCAFFSVVNNEELVKQYVAKICSDIRSQLTLFRNRINTIFIGGGNPTSIGAENLDKIVKQILSCVEVRNIEEFTIESNPETISNDVLSVLKHIPGVRLSMGVQRLSDSELNILGRVGSMNHINRTFELVSSEFNNISADFILGVPSCDDIRNELLKFVNRYPIQHVSAYFLSVENGTILKKRIDNNELQATDNISPEEMFSVIDVLSSKGFEHYEISNYSQPGFECKHNINYWHQGEYIGLGPSAVGTIAGVRTLQPDNIAEWLNDENLETEVLTEVDRRNEYVMLNLRLIKNGLSITDLEKLYGKQTISFYNALKDNEDNGFLKISNEIVKLTPKGISFSNSVMGSLFWEESK